MKQFNVVVEGGDVFLVVYLFNNYSPKTAFPTMARTT